jgi:hypothetical protein
MSAESENYIIPIFPAEDELEEDESLNVQEGGAPSVEPKDFLNKYATKLLEMFKNGYSTTFSKVLPPIDSILKFKDDGSVIEMKSIDDMKANKVDKAFQNFPNLVLYQFLQKVALYQSFSGAVNPDYDINKHIALIEISVRLYILSYFLAMKNDNVALKDQFTDLSKKYFDNKEVTTYNKYFKDLKATLPKFQSGLFNNPTETDNKDLEIISNVLAHYGIVYFKLGNKFTKLQRKDILATENLYFYNTMSEMLDDLIAKVPEPAGVPPPAVAAPAVEGQAVAANAGVPPPAAAADAAGVGLLVAPPAAAAPVEGQALAGNAGVPAAAVEEQVVGEAAAVEGQAVVGEAAPVVGNAGRPAAAAPGNLQGGSRKNRRSHRRNTSRKNRED